MACDRRWRRATGSLFAASIAALSGCVFFVPSTAVAGHCAFAGSTTECGACIAARCASEVDTCCRTDDCEGEITTVEACAQKGDASCATFASYVAKAGANANAGLLAACIAKGCATYCQALVGTSQTNCEEDLLSEGRSCSCSFGAPTNDFTCASSVLPSTRCCAPEGWPGSAQVCDCKVVACEPAPDGCTCTLTDNYATGTPTKCTGANCCVGNGLCRCGARACEPYETQVDTCTLDGVHCDQGQIEVASCSIRK